MTIGSSFLQKKVIVHTLMYFQARLVVREPCCFNDVIINGPPICKVKNVLHHLQKRYRYDIEKLSILKQQS